MARSIREQMPFWVRRPLLRRVRGGVVVRRWLSGLREVVGEDGGVGGGLLKSGPPLGRGADA